MRKKLILYFKRRNHARKQWVSRELNMFDSAGALLLMDDEGETGPADPGVRGHFKQTKEE